MPKVKSDPAIKINGLEFIKEYQGIWYEMAYIPSAFEKETDCTGAVAVYSDLDEANKMFKVTNFCLSKSRSCAQIGVAEVLSDTEARLMVTFPESKIPKFVNDAIRKSGGDCWIIDYEKGVYSVACSPDLQMLWILARDPSFIESQRGITLVDKYMMDPRFHNKLKKRNSTSQYMDFKKLIEAVYKKF